MIKINVKDSKGSVKTVQIERTAMSSELRIRAAAINNITDVGTVKLIFRGKLLVDDNTLESYDIKDDNVVMILIVNKTPEQIQNEKEYNENKAVNG